MALANDSIDVTPGSGVSVATQLVSGKEYQVVMHADSSGNIVGSSPIYRLLVPAQAVGANKVMCDLFNATGSGKTIKVLSAFAYVDNDTAVTGVVGVEVAMTRTTAVGTGGTSHTFNGTSLTAASIASFDTDFPALPAGVTARAAPTGGATGGAWIATRWLFTEETNASSGLAGLVGAEFVRNAGAELTVRENQGLRFLQGAVASVGNVSFEVTFELV